MNKRAIILSISTGQGHHEIGRTLNEKFKEYGVDAIFIDAYEYASKSFSKVIEKGYLLGIKYTPNLLLENIYNITAKKDTRSKKYTPIRIVNTVLTRRLKKLIKDFNPNYIVATHVLSSMILDEIKIKDWSNAKMLGVVTDFTVHPFWQNTTMLDYIVTPSELLTFQLLNKGIDMKKIKPLGIPIGDEFLKKVPKKTARKKLGVDPDKKTILISGGSMGHGRLDRVLEKIAMLDYDFQIILVCGNNKKLFRMASKLKLDKPLKVLGFTKEMPLCMDASDIIITKPGGRTVCESLAKGLPMILNNPIAGHETRNAEFLLNNAVAFYSKKEFPVEEALNSLLYNEERTEIIKKAIKLLSKPNATEDIVRLLVGK